MIDFYRICFNRPAFNNIIHYRRDLKGEGFDDAIKDTITAINTGCLRDRISGKMLRPLYIGNLYLTDRRLHQQMNLISELLQKIRDTYAQHIDNIDGYSQIGMVRTMDQARAEVMTLFNQMCVEAGMPPLKFKPALPTADSL